MPGAPYLDNVCDFEYNEIHLLRNSARADGGNYEMRFAPRARPWTKIMSFGLHDARNQTLITKQMAGLWNKDI